MAINGGYDICGLLGVPRRSVRVECFAWLYAAQVSPSEVFLSSTSLPERQCWDLLNAQVPLREKIQNAVHMQWIPEADIGWISADTRQSGWIQRYIASAMRAPSGSAASGNNISGLREDWIPTHLLGANRSVALVDYWLAHMTCNVSLRHSEVKKLQTKWLQQVRADQRFAWLESDDADVRRAIYWRKLTEGSQWIRERFPEPRSHADLLSVLDIPEINPAELELVNIKTKRHFQQQIRRAKNTDKRQCNFLLDAKTVAKLEALARKHGIPRTSVIEMLIQEEAVRNVLIPERLRSRSLKPLGLGL